MIAMPMYPGNVERCSNIFKLFAASELRLDFGYVLLILRESSEFELKATDILELIAAVLERACGGANAETEGTIR